MDRATRNAIERATQRARKLLEEDFAAQLEGDFDVHRDGGVATKAGEHLSARQAFQRERIVAAIEHKHGAGMTAADSVEDYLRDAAFTTLNRFVALKMLEARELLQECITKGEQSAGYREFCGMAPGLPLLAESAGYRLYIESLFDELSTEVKVLFDRRDPSSVLWPKRATFEQILDILNAAELARVWGEDETIGWVYQFFNGQDERKKMREESQAPRNSRELAVRNQFFTPRYVVQFLTDNTLGRIWYEMRETQTLLAERCEYMVHRPCGASAPRAKKDPRDLRVLDPACGSGHFLLYAFGLLLAIYDEAFSDPESPRSEATGKSLAEDYPNLGALRRAIPSIILAHNLYGVDIDPRCVQIAQLALWMRAQMAYRDFGVGREERAQIRRSNIVVAEPLVADEQIAEEFVARLGDADLGQVFTALVDTLKLAGEMGPLLRVEQFVGRKAQRGKTGDFFAPPEARIRAALSKFVGGEGGTSNTRRRLFADDASQGLGLLAVVENRYDVVVMNPPFGLVPDRVKSAFQEAYPEDWTEIYACFFARALELVESNGFVGAITSNLWLITQRQLALRTRLVSSRWRVNLVLDLGGGVLDGAAVETALTIINSEPSSTTQYADVSAAAFKDSAVLRTPWVTVDASHFRRIPNTPFSFFLGEARLALWDSPSRLEPDVAVVAKGNTTFDNFRFLRLHWEVDAKAAKERWIWYDKGGEFQPFWAPTPLVWRFTDAAKENRAFQITKYNTDAQVCQSSRWWRKSGLSYPHVTSVGFSPRILPRGQVAGSEALGVYPLDERYALPLLALLCSTHTQDLVHAFGRHRKVENRAISGLPISIDLIASGAQELQACADRGVALTRQLVSTAETSPTFLRPPLERETETLVAELAKTLERIDHVVGNLLWQNDVAPIPVAERRSNLAIQYLTARFGALTRNSHTRRWISFAVGIAFGRFPVPSPDHQMDTSDPFAELEIGLGGSQSDAPLVGRVLVDDKGHESDVVACVGAELSRLEMLFSTGVSLHGDALRDFLALEFFSTHLAEYSLLGRKAPIYWQLASPTLRYSVWISFHSLSKDTFFRIQNDYVASKLAHEERRADWMARDVRENGTASQRKELAAQEGFVEELRAFLEEVKRIAPLWSPNLDDGAVINCALLWRLVPQNNSWQKELKSTWDELCEGKYDWAHLAMHLWPERVVPKCAKDRSLAIAHGFEDIFWVEGTDHKWAARKTPVRSVDDVVRESTSPAVKSALKSLVEAPSATSNGRTGRGGRRRATDIAEGGNV